MKTPPKLFRMLSGCPSLFNLVYNMDENSEGCVSYMRKIVKYSLLLPIAIFGIVLLSSWIYHLVKVAQEKKQTPPIGEMVEVNGHAMHLYTDGKGAQTIVLLAGGGTSSPTLDFKPLWSSLIENYQIAVVEKAGYGWSDIANISRDIDFLLEETRTALSLAGQHPPYVLAAHSMSGLEAIRWAQKYPEEVEAIIGLDAAIPEVYDVLDIPSPIVQTLTSFAGRVGLLRHIPSIADNSAAIHSGNLSTEDEETYRALLNRRTVTKNMVEEAKQVEQNAKVVKQYPVPTEIPMYFFISNGKEIGLDQWEQIPITYTQQLDNGVYMQMDAGHYLHTYEPEIISKEIHTFLESLNKENLK